MKLLFKLFGKNFAVSGSQEAKRLDYANYYPMTAICKNCSHTTNLYIKKGVHVVDIINKVKKITDWYEHIVNNRQEKNQLKLDKKPLRELEYFLEKIKKPIGDK